MLFQNALENIVERNGTQPPEGWEIRTMNKWWASHSAHIHSHHSNEDDLFNPYLRTRFDYPEKLEADHTELLRHMEMIEEAMNELSTETGGGVEH